MRKTPRAKKQARANGPASPRVIDESNSPMTIHTVAYKNGADIGPIPPPRPPEFVSLWVYIKIGAAVGSALVTVILAIAGALHASGYLDNPARQQEVTAISEQMKGLATHVTALHDDAIEIKAEMKSDRIQTEDARRRFETTLQEIKAQIPIPAPPAPPPPVPVPVRKRILHPKTAANNPSLKSLWIGEATR